MNTILLLIAGIVYILALLCFAAIVFLPMIGFGVWSNQSNVGYAFDIPEYLRVICLILLILMVGGGLYFLWQNTPSLQ